MLLLIKLSRRFQCARLCTSATPATTVDSLQRHLGIPRAKAEYIVLKHPSVTKYDSEHIQQVVDAVRQLGIEKSELAEEPVMFTALPVTLKHRYSVLRECGFNNVTAANLSKYLNIVRRRSITQLKKAGLISATTNVESRLADIFTQWPTSRSTSSIKINESSLTLHELRMKILKRYLELVIDLSEDEFSKAINVYVRIKHRSFHAINETLMLLQNHLLMPIDKIRSNLFLIHAEPENIKNLLYQVRSIGGVDMKQILGMYPKLCTTNYETVLGTVQLFKEYGISNEAQIRCFEIYTLSTDTVRERLERAKSVPEFEALFSHPRVLKLIHYEKRAVKRLDTIYKNTNKKCLSLNILSGSSAHFSHYEKAPGDRSKGKDLINGIISELGSKCDGDKVREILKRHPFWINIPLVKAKFVYNKLLLKFTLEDIYENCTILFYPWNKIDFFLKMLSTKQSQKIQYRESECIFLEHLNTSELSNSQILSLTLYLMEYDHYFSGNGVWNEEKLKEIYDLEENKTKASMGS